MTEWKLPEVYSFEGRLVRYGVCGDGPLVVVVHGTPWSSFNLRYLIKEPAHKSKLPTIVRKNTGLLPPLLFAPI